MPKISEFGGPTDENQPGYYSKGRSFQSPKVVETDPDVVAEEQAEQDREGDDVSAGSSSSPSETSTVPSAPSRPTGRRSSAPTTATPSRKAPKGNSGARSTAGSGKAGS